MSAFTLVSRSPSALLNHIARLPRKLSNSTTLFALSSNTPPLSLSPLLTAIASSAKTSVGCLSDALSPDLIACSLAYFDSAFCTPFRSKIKGREAVSVGRARKRYTQSSEEGVSKLYESERINWQDVWGRNFNGERIPVELRGLPCVTKSMTRLRGQFNPRPQDVSAVLFLSTPAHEGLSNALASGLPSSASVRTARFSYSGSAY
jgi:hypothetical protein